MTTERINELEEQIKALIRNELLRHEEISTPLHIAKTILELLTQADINPVTATTRHEILMITEKFVTDSVELEKNRRDYLLSVQTTN